MAFLDDLQYGVISTSHGILYGVGFTDDAIYFEWSDDNGVTKKELKDGSTKRFVGTSEEEQPAIVITVTGEIIVSMTDAGDIYTFLSKDSGNSWNLISTI